MSGPFIGTPNAELGLMVHGNIVGGRVHPHRVGSGKRERPALIRCGSTADDWRILVLAHKRAGRLSIGTGGGWRAYPEPNRPAHLQIFMSASALSLKSPCEGPGVASVGRELWCGGRATDEEKICGLLKHLRPPEREC